LVVSEVAKKLNIVPFSGLIVKVVPRLIWAVRVYKDESWFESVGVWGLNVIDKPHLEDNLGIRQ
jgi:hypothetical protein